MNTFQTNVDHRSEKLHFFATTLFGIENKRSFDSVKEGGERKFFFSKLIYDVLNLFKL